ncbi:AMMECR1 domain-containing protein [Candidatus Gracilibacteria bacterium]|nr:AMMECR1 domain-containing protein [Candidatus Gracilibacteria bacterium]
MRSETSALGVHKIAKKVIEIYLNEKKIPTLDELGISKHPDLNTKNLSFVTLYKDGKVIASSGRINLKKPNTIAELIENSLFCLKDPRFIEAIKNPAEINNVNFRVDIITPSQREVINKIDEVDIKKNGLILISQSHSKIGVILPNIANLITTNEDLFTLVCKKAELDPALLKAEDYILYKIESTIFSDF